ncbi:MAG: formylglycine-generating enzyme family protein [Spirulina sp. SIO3F2]|nr:formylglycine-generating enzyme family protein [Spirulina sp. SIO3F2]
MVALPENLSIYRYRRKNQCFHEDLGDGVQLTLMLIPAGEFWMGAPESELESRDNERPRHQVQVPQFLMGCYPVTQAQWQVVAGYPQERRQLKLNPSNFEGDNRPVEQVSWDDATEFCQRLSNRTGRLYRLPSEAEWEYACRAGTETPFHFGETITTDLANYRGTDWKELNESGSYGDGPKGEYREETTEVGQFPANAWGLHDMHGNVWEWCEDDWHGSYNGAPDDGGAWVEADRSETNRVLRGGSGFNIPGFCRSAVRSSSTRGDFDGPVGFRVVCDPPRTLLGS